MDSEKQITEQAVSLEELNVMLERVITFISNCDTKSSFVLSSLGVVMTILFTLKPIKFDTVKKVFCNASCDSIEYWILVVGIICIVIFIFGIYNLLNVLKARIKPIGYPLSNVLFGDIAKSKTYNDYERLLNEATSENYRRDLITQIFINSRVCRKKHLLFNEGLKFVSYPLPLIFCCWGYLF